jgi:hypothetical protein
MSGPHPVEKCPCPTCLAAVRRGTEALRRAHEANVRELFRADNMLGELRCKLKAASGFEQQAADFQRLARDLEEANSKAEVDLVASREEVKALSGRLDEQREAFRIATSTADATIARLRKLVADALHGDTVLWLGEYRQRIRRWITSTFGVQSGIDRRERASRVVEEAVELAQAEGLGAGAVARIARRVYSRPKGEPSQEAAGLGVCLIAWANAAGLNLDAAIRKEVDRIESIPACHFRAKQTEKAAAGTGRPLTDDRTNLTRQFTFAQPFRGFPPSVPPLNQADAIDAVLSILLGSPRSVRR